MGVLKTVVNILFLLLICDVCVGQKPSDYESLKKKYPGEKAVIINDQDDILIEVVNNSFRVKETVVKETYLIQNEGNDYAADQVYSSQFANIKEIEAKTLVPEGDKFVTKKVDKFIDAPSQPDYVFYDEQITKSFIFPAVQTGAITSVTFMREMTNPLVAGSFFFKWHIPCEISRISIKSDKRAKLKFKLFNIEPSTLEFTQQEKGKYIIYTWTAKNIKSAYNESDAPDLRYYYPHIVYSVENTNPSDTIHANFNGLGGLYHYYHSLVKDINTKDDPSIGEMVEKIIAGATSEEEKVKRIFYWVQDNINYVAFEAGMQGLIPEQASLVFSKRYGDCKGMSSLIHTMLKIAGVKSYLTWIGTRQLPYKYTDIPSQIVDNHMIVTYYNHGEPIFLDGTNNYLAFGMPSSMIQGKQALVGIDEINYKIEEVPIVPSNQNIFNDSVAFTIRNNVIEGVGMLSLTGYEKNQRTYHLTGKDKLNYKERVLGIVGKGNNKFYLDTFSIGNLSNRESPLKIGYRFRINDYFREIDGEAYVNMNLSRPFLNATYDPDKRRIPVENNSCSLLRYVTVFEIPEGYQLSLLPKDKSGSLDELSFAIHYKVEGRTITQVKEVRDNYLILFPSEFAKWNEVVESLNQSYRDILILQKIKN